MIQHVVLFRFAATDDGQRDRDAAELRRRLEGLVGAVPGVDVLRVRSDLGDHDGHWDAVLLSEHPTREALQEYATDPRHLEVITWVDGVVSERAVVDVELD